MKLDLSTRELKKSTKAENVDESIDLLYDIAFNSLFDIESGDSVRNTMLSAVTKLQENPAYTLERMVNQAVFYRTGLANPKFGTMTTISRMTSSDSMEFFERILTPKNTILSVVGDVDADEIYEKVMQTFYKKFVEGGEYKKLKYVAPIENFVGGERTKNKKLNQSRIFLAFPAISFKSSKKYDIEIALPIIKELINDYVSDATYFHNVNISYENYANNGKLTIETMVDYGHVNEFLDLVIEAIKYVVEEGLSEDAFEDEKSVYIVNLMQSNERVSDLSKSSAREVAINKQSFNLASELMKIELLTVTDTEKVLDEVFDFTKLYIAYLGNPVEIQAIDYID